MTRRLVALALSCLVSLGVANADVFRPAYLELRELGGDTYQVLWKVPALGQDRRLALQVTFPEATEHLGQRQPFVVDGAWSERWQIYHPGGLAGKTIYIEGNAADVTDVIARIERLDGSTQVERLEAGARQFDVLAAASTPGIAWSYTVLGFEHILGGIDHLLFVFALLLIVSGAKRIVATVTAFTVAHSLTLVAATLGWIRVPGPPVEAVIALSIVFVASEVLRSARGQAGLTARAPWVVAFTFGLLHGLGFAGALAETGLPQNAIPVALLMFNVGVELGQLAFVAMLLVLAAFVRRLAQERPGWPRPVAAYLVGAIASFWTIERVVSFWQ